MESEDAGAGTTYVQAGVSAGGASPGGRRLGRRRRRRRLGRRRVTPGAWCRRAWFAAFLARGPSSPERAAGEASSRVGPRLKAGRGGGSGGRGAPRGWDTGKSARAQAHRSAPGARGEGGAAEELELGARAVRAARFEAQVGLVRCRTSEAAQIGVPSPSAVRPRRWAADTTGNGPGLGEWGDQSGGTIAGSGWREPGPRALTCDRSSPKPGQTQIHRPGGWFLSD